MRQLKSITLDKTNLKKIFNCKYGFSGIRIKKIIIPTLSRIPISEWGGILSELSISFNSTATNGAVSKHPIYLIAYLSPFQSHPVFDFNFFEPEANEHNLQALSTFYNLLEIELTCPKESEMKVDVFYEEYPIIS
jgi:hypothetical protein